MAIEKIVIVTKPTQLEELLKTHAISSQVEFYLSQNGMSYRGVREEHDDYQATLREIKSKIPQGVSFQQVSKYDLPRFEARKGELLVPIGDPGLVINCAKSANSQPVYAINSNPNLYENVFVTSTVKDFSSGLQKVLRGEYEIIPVTMAQATLDDGREVLGVNDIFVGKSDQTSARYSITHRGETENQSSSGVVISTGAGKTGWMSSILDYEPEGLGLDSNKMIFAVREAFESKTTDKNINKGYLYKSSELEITSQMPNNGIIFADGMIDLGTEFQAGRKVTIGVSDKKFNLIKNPNVT